MTIALEQLADDSISDRNFHKLAQLVLDTGGKTIGIRFGSTTVTFTASKASAETSFAHGLAKTPVAVYVGYRHATGSSILFSAYASTISSTTLGVSMNADTAITGPVTVDWVVIG